MITSINYNDESFIYTDDGNNNSVINFSDVTNTSSDIFSGCLNFTIISGSTVAIPKNIFIESLKYNHSANTDSTLYNQWKLIHKLARVLDGMSTSDADAEIANLEAQRDAAETAFNTQDTVNQDAIVDWVAKKEVNNAYDAYNVLITDLQNTIAAKQAIIVNFNATTGAVMQELWMYSSEDIDSVKVDYFGKLREYVDAQADLEGLDPNNPNYGSETNRLATLLESVRVDLVKLGQTAIDLLAAQKTADEVTLSDMQETLAGMTYHNDLGDLPEKNEITAIRSVTMRKLYYITTVAQDGWSNPTLATVSVSDIASYENDYGEIILP